jgi:hypothetical protein
MRGKGCRTGSEVPTRGSRAGKCRNIWTADRPNQTRIIRIDRLLPSQKKERLCETKSKVAGSVCVSFSGVEGIWRRYSKVGLKGLYHEMLGFCFLWVYVGLIMLAACTVLSPRLFASYWSAGGGTFLQVSSLASDRLEDCANCTPTPEENNQYSANIS